MPPLRPTRLARYPRTGGAGLALWLLAALVCGLATAQDPPAIPATDAGEPNNTRDTATDAKLDTRIPITINPVGDYDFYRVTVPGDGYLWPELDNSKATNIRPALMTYHADGYAVGWPIARVRAGGYTVLAYDQGNDRASPEELGLTLRFYPEIDPSEPNDRPDQARDVRVNTPYTFNLMPVKDVDCFRVAIPQTGYLRVVVDGSNATNLEFSIETPAPGTGVPQWGNETRLEAGAHLVRIMDSYLDEASPGELTVTFQFFPETDDSEPNRSFNRSRPVQVDRDVPFQIMPRSDGDSFRYRATAPGYLTVGLERPEGTQHMEPVVEIFDPTLAKIGGWDAFLARAGDYRILIQDSYNDESSPVSMNARFTFTPLADTSEPNNTIARARTIPLNEAVPYRILPVKDQDYFRVVAPADGFIQLEYPRDSQGRLELGSAIYDAQFKTIGRYDARVRKGDVYFHIADAYDDESSLEQLRVTAHFYPLDASIGEQATPDSPARPRTLTSGEAVTFRLLPVGDRDYFRLDVSDPGVVSVAIDRGQAPHVDLTARIYDENWRYLGNNNVYAAPGPIYLQILDAYEDESSPGMSTLTVTHTPVPEDHVLRRLSDAAVDATFDQVINLSLSQETPYRVYRLRPKSPGKLTPELAWSTAAPRGVQMQVYDDKARLLPYENQCLPPAVMYLRIWADPAVLEQPATATLTPKFQPVTDPSEPNNLLGQAKKTKPNATETFAIYPMADTDAFELTVTEPSALWVALDTSKAAHLDMTVEIYDSAYQKVGDWVAPLQPGRYFVWIHETQYNEESTELLTATFHVYPQTDATEPNDTLATARVAKPNSTMDMHIMPLADRDCFRLALPEPGYLQVSRNQEQAPELELVAHIYDQDMRYVGDWHALLDAGDAYVMVKEAQDNEVDPDPLQVSFQFTPQPDADEPNDRPMLARDVQPGTPFSYHLLPGWDVDTFRLATPGEGTVVALASPANTNEGQPWLKLLNGDFEELGQIAGRSTGDVTYIQAGLSYQKAFVPQPLSATVLFLPDSASAQALTDSGETLLFDLSQPGRAQSHAVRLTEPAYLNVEAIMPPESLAGSSIRIIGPDGQHVAIGSPELQPTGLYHVVYFAGAGSSPDPVAVHVSATPPLDLNEPNDSEEDATPLTLPADTWIAVQQDNADWFSFDIPEAGLYEIRADYAGRPNPHLRFEELVRVLPEARYGVPHSYHFANAEYATLYVRCLPGTHHLRLSSSQRGGGNDGLCRLRIYQRASASGKRGDVRIMAFGIEPTSGDYQKLAALSGLIDRDVSTGSDSQDIAAELEESIVEALGDGSDTDPIIAAAQAEANQRGRFVRAILFLLILIGVIGLYAIGRRRRPSSDD